MAFQSLLTKWNKTINLVSKSTISDFWNRHIIDSAQIFQDCPTDATTWLDAGSGGGLPGVVVSILSAEHMSDLTVTLVESDQRKATFLRTVARELELNIQVKTARIEELPPLNADVFSARAMAPLSDLLGYAELHLGEGGIAILPKGERHAEEVSIARRYWNFDVAGRPSLTDKQSRILVVKGIERVVT